jgi:uncharacterized protein (DUF58 family)
MPTRRGLGLLVGAVACWLVGRFLGVAELYVLAVAAATLVAAGAFLVRLEDRRLAVRRRLSASRARPGETVQAAVDLRNDGRLGTGVLLVEDRCPYALRAGPAQTSPRFLVPGVASGATQTISYGLTATTRGRWVIGPLRLRMRDPFGVAERARGFTATSELVVYPQVEALAAGARMGAHIGSGTRDQRRLIGSGDEFHTIREYRTGDDLRRVHWASTARRQGLMVRQTEQAWVARATVLLDARTAAHRGVGTHSTFEAAVVAAASVLAHLDGLGYETRLSIAGANDAARPPDTLDDQMARLATVEPRPRASLRGALDSLRVTDGLLVAVVGVPAGDPASDPEVRGLLAAGRRFSSKVALVAAHGDSPGFVAMLTGARWRATILDDGPAAAWGRIVAQTTYQVRS